MIYILNFFSCVNGKLLEPNTIELELVGVSKSLYY